MTEFDFGRAREFLRNKYKKQEEKHQKLFEQAWQDFNRIAAMIIEKYQPQRIYQWGSLLNPRHFSEISDIDIAVEGTYDPEKFFQMLGDADSLTDFPLDLVEIDKIDPIHAESIRKKGRLVYERK